MDIDDYSNDQLIATLRERGVLSPFEDVGAFHLKMALPYFMNTRPHAMTNAEFHFRVKAMFEELTEFTEAHARHDLAGQADALVDLVYFALGTAHYLAIPFDDVWRAVHNANMQKRRWQEGDPVKPRSTMNQFQFDVVKPEGWRAPDVHEIIKNHTDRYFK